MPVAPELEHEGEEHGHEGEDEKHGKDFKVANSAEESYGFTVGTSYLLDNGYVGVSLEQYNREYGIPGHSHGDEEEHGHEDEHGDEGHSEENVFADLEQTKIQFLSELNFRDSILSGINTRVGFTDYEHAEVENSEIGTNFKNQTFEARVEILHQSFGGFNGGVSFHYKRSDVEAQGSEAFTPPSKTEMFAVALMEERHIGDVLLQLGARAERITLSANRVLLPLLDAHGHDDEDMDEDEGEDGHGHDHEHDHQHDDEHGHGSDATIIRTFYAEHEFTPVSLSAGVLWNFHPSYNLGLSLARSQRAPSASELLSFGPHIGTRTYEVGALFALEQHDGSGEIGLTEEIIDLETANNIDLSFRKTQGDVGFIFNLFYNQVDNYYYQTDTGLFADDGHNHGEEDGHGHDEHDHGEEDGHEDEHGGELPVFIFQTDDVVLNGFEAQVAWQVNDTFNVTVFSDFVRARLKNGGNLPRTPPFRVGTQLSYETETLSAHLDITRYQSQGRISAFETETDGYTLIDLHADYTLPYFNESIAVYFKGENLSDTEARVHTSFLKDIAPRPSRNFTVGIKGYF